MSHQQASAVTAKAIEMINSQLIGLSDWVGRTEYGMAHRCGQDRFGLARRLA
jgi:hypothetical protein